MKAYVVVRRAWGKDNQYLVLSGPFEYPSWTSSLEEATVMRMAKASIWSSIVSYEGQPEPKIVEAQRALQPIQAVEEPSPDTKREGWKNAWYGGFGGIPGAG